MFVFELKACCNLTVSTVPEGIMIGFGGGGGGGGGGGSGAGTGAGAGVFAGADVGVPAWAD